MFLEHGSLPSYQLRDLLFQHINALALVLRRHQELTSCGSNTKLSQTRYRTQRQRKKWEETGRRRGGSIVRLHGMASSNSEGRKARVWQSEAKSVVGGILRCVAVGRCTCNAGNLQANRRGHDDHSRPRRASDEGSRTFGTFRS